MIPIAGSAYTYAYATMGELMAWIIGWDLVLEYAVGASTVSISWSSYVVQLLHTFGIHLPAQWIAGPFEPVTLPDGNVVQGIANIPAVIIVFLISMLLMIGIKESARTNGIIVVIKLAVVATLIGVGWMFINRANYVPFIPHEHRRVRPLRTERHHAGRGGHFLRLYRLRRGLHGRAGGQEPAEGHAHRHHRLAGHLHGAVRAFRRASSPAWSRIPSSAWRRR